MFAGLAVITQKLSIKKPGKNKGCRDQRGGVHCTSHSGRLTLADISPGSQARVTGFCSGISSDRKAHLLAYGLAPGYWVRVMQHSPVTVVQVEQTELAMELDLACEILVDSN